MNKKNFLNALSKANDFISKLTPLHFDLLGFPSIKTHSDYIDVCFTTGNTIRSLEVLVFPSNEFRLYAEGSSVVIEFTFYADVD